MSIFKTRALHGLRIAGLCMGLALSSAQAGPGGPDHSHGPEQPAAASKQSPRLIAVSENHQLVGILRNGEVTFYLDRQQDNAPVEGATLTLDIGGTSHTASPQADGSFRLPASALGAGPEAEVIATIAGPIDDLLIGTIRFGQQAAASAAHHEHGFSAFLHRRISMEAGLIGGTLAAVAALLVGFMIGRRGRGAALAVAALVGLAMMDSRPAQAGPGGPDHSHGPETATAEDGDAPRRRADGLIFVPKPTQRLLELRTRKVEIEQASATISLPGRVVAHPAARAVAQAETGGRVSAAGPDWPLRGQRVQAGDALALVTSPMAANGAAGGGWTLRAPLEGVLTAVNAVQGQLVAQGDTLFEIVDPARVRIEVDLFRPVSLGPNTQATIEARGAPAVAVSFKGLAPASVDRPATAVFEAVDASGLEIGRRVHVVASTSQTIKGVILPRDAVVLAQNGLPVVFRHAEPELFEPRIVRVEPLDATRVVIVAGVEAGEQILVRGALLVNQIR